jgi:hypothetical protein
VHYSEQRVTRGAFEPVISRDMANVSQSAFMLDPSFAFPVSPFSFGFLARRQQCISILFEIQSGDTKQAALCILADFNDVAVDFLFNWVSYCNQATVSFGLYFNSLVG